MIDATRLAVLCVEPDAWAVPLSEACELFEINTNQRLTMFLAQCAHESASFSRVVENLNYSAERLLAVWPTRFKRGEAELYAHKPEAIANRVYANRNGNHNEQSGDGWRFRGRGPLQLTFFNNYWNAGKDCGAPFDSNPDAVAMPQGGALASAWFWWKNGCNEVADDGDYTGVSGIINRGDRHMAATGLNERWQWYRAAQAAFA